MAGPWPLGQGARPCARSTRRPLPYAPVTPQHLAFRPGDCGHCRGSSGWPLAFRPGSQATAPALYDVKRPPQPLHGPGEREVGEEGERGHKGHLPTSAKGRSCSGRPLLTDDPADRTRSHVMS